jgi:hypothetical protein
MLADIYIAQVKGRQGTMDLHRHATFSCTLGRISRTIRQLFRGLLHAV